MGTGEADAPRDGREGAPRAAAARPTAPTAEVQREWRELEVQQNQQSSVARAFTVPLSPQELSKLDKEASNRFRRERRHDAEQVATDADEKQETSGKLIAQLQPCGEVSRHGTVFD